MMPLSFNAQPILCYVTDRLSLSRDRSPEYLPERGPENAVPANPFAPLLACITAVAAAGIDWIQLREKDLSAVHYARLTRAAIASRAGLNPSGQASSAAHGLIIVNDRLDVALAEHAGGVHLGENSVPIAEARRLLQNVPAENPRARFLTGGSCHSLATARAAAAAGADYLFFGPIFATPSKTMFGEPQGLARLAEVCQAVAIPVLAIGGVTAENAPHCLDSGAAGIAAIRLFQQSRDLPQLANSLRARSRS
jgi:thiamine-phosphate pyrophosphorylase